MEKEKKKKRERDGRVGENGLVFFVCAAIFNGALQNQMYCTACTPP